MLHRLYMTIGFAICFCGIAAAQTLDFQDRECIGEGAENQGIMVKEDGFTITKGDEEAAPFRVLCTGSESYPCSTALYNGSTGGLIMVTKDDGGSFSALEIGVVSILDADVVPVSFRGIKAEGGLVFHKIETDGRPPFACMETFTFPDTFTDLVRLEWNQMPPFHQFDDLVLVASDEKCNYTIRKSKSIFGCKSCPVKGDDVGTEEACESVKSCNKRLKTVVDCPEGGRGFCKIKGRRSSCK